jgi:hypothetical protein
MRKPLLAIVPALLASLPGQDPVRPAAPVATPLVVAPAAAPFEPTTADVAAAAQSQLGRVAERVVFDRPTTDGPLWAMGADWKASFDGQGFTFLPFFGTDALRHYPVRVELASATVAGEALKLVPGAPQEAHGVVTTRRGGLVETVATTPDLVEQSFAFATLPTRGDVTVAVRIATDLAATPITGGVRFANERGHVDYTKAIAVDAAGRRRELPIEWAAGIATMTIPAEFVATAQLPLVLDPILNGWYALASGQTRPNLDSDVASFQSLGGRTLFVYRREWNSADRDCFGILFDGNLGLVQTDFTIDLTADDWRSVAVASNNYARNFLVVAEIAASGPIYIGGRTCAANAAVGSLFPIERENVLGTPGNNVSPDVGGDPYPGSGTYAVAFVKNYFSSSTVCLRSVSTTGVVLGTNATVVQSGGGNPKDKVSISKSCGLPGPAGLPTYWLCAWQEPYVNWPYDREVYGRHVNWNGQLIGSVPVALAMSTEEETAPAASSPLDVDGARYWPVCYETAPSGATSRDIACRMVSSATLPQSYTVISGNVPGHDDRDVECDSDGVRMVASLITGTPAYPQQIEKVLISYLRASNTLRQDARGGLNTSSLTEYASPCVSADASGPDLTSRFYIGFSNRSNNTFELSNFGGWTGGTLYFAPDNNACGNLSFTPSGVPAVGQTITLSAGNGALSGVMIGFPSYVPLLPLGCSCWSGVDQSVFFGNPFVWTVPNNVAFIGFQLATQAYTLLGSQCLGMVDFSQSYRFTVR